jgi:hypothetical protein
MSISLPPVIQAIQMDELKLPPPAPAPAFKAQVDLQAPIKKIVICTTRDIAKEDMAIFEGYGKVIEYDHDIHNNLPASAFPYDYLIIDLRESGDRYFLMRNILPFKNEYAIVVYSFAFERDEIVPEADNHISSFPKKLARKEDYELILFQQRICKPKWYMSLLSCVLSTYHQVKK